MLQMTMFTDKSCFLEANSSSSSQETSWTLWSPSVQHKVHKSLKLVLILSQINPVHIFQSYSFEINFHIFKHNQQDATIHIDIYYYKCSTCFRWFPRPSSGAQNCTQSIRYLLSFYCFLPLS